MNQNLNELCKFIYIEAKIIHRNLESNKIQFSILKRILNSDSILSKENIEDVNYVVKILERNINSMEKFEETIQKKIASKAKLLDLKLKIEQQKEKFKTRLSHLEYNSLKYIYGGAFGRIPVLFTESFLGTCGTLMVAACCANPPIAIVAASLGIGLLLTVAEKSATQYLTHSSKDNIEKFEKLDFNAEKLLLKMEKIVTLLHSLYVVKSIIKYYIIKELQDCLKNETLRKENFGISDTIFDENEKLTELLTKIIAPETTCNT
jgi:hypothetical protein